MLSTYLGFVKNVSLFIVIGVEELRDEQSALRGHHPLLLKMSNLLDERSSVLRSEPLSN